MPKVFDIAPPSVKPVFIFILVCLSVCAFAQTSPNYVFGQLSKEQGLTQITVNSVLQDRSGYIWAATQGGINRFDGEQLKTITQKSSNGDLIEDYTNVLVHSPDGNILALGQHSLSHIDSHSLQVTNLATFPDQKLGLPSAATRNAIVTPQNHLWIFTSQGMFVKTPANPWVQVTTELKLRRHLVIDGQSWLAESSGLYQYDPDNVSWRHLPYPNSAKLKSISCFTRIKDVLFICTDSGLYQYSVPLDFRSPLTEIQYVPFWPLGIKGKIVFIEQNQQGDYWLAGESGLFVLPNDFDQHSKARIIEKSSNGRLLHDNAIKSALMDNNQTLWLGTTIAGLQYLTPKALLMPFIGAENGLVEPIAASTYADGDNIWHFSYKGHITYFKQNEHGEIVKQWMVQPTNADGEFLNFISSNVVDGQGHQWVASFKGVVKLDTQGNYTSYPVGRDDTPVIKTLFTDHKKTLYLFEYFTGLWRFDAASDRFEAVDLGVQREQFYETIQHVQTVNNRIWVSTTEQRLFELNLTANTLVERRLLDKQGAPLKIAAQSLAQDNQGYLWLAGNEGLVRVNLQSNVAEFISQRQGMPATNNFYYMFIHQNDLWVSQVDSVIRLNTRTLDAEIIRQADGLPFSEFSNKGSVRYDANNRVRDLLLTGLEGVMLLDITRWPETALSTVQVTAVEQLINPETDTWQWLSHLGNEVVLPAEHEQIRIEFASFSVAHQSSVQYRYKLIDYDQKWHLAKNPYATYKHLPGDDYQFQLQYRLSNRDGQWQDSQSQLRIHVEKRWWQTITASVLWVLLILLLLTLMMKWRVRVLDRKSKQLQQLVAQRTATIEELQGQRARLFSHVAHEFRTPLSMMIGPAKDIQQQLQTNQLSDLQFIKQSMVRIVANGDKLTSMLDRLFSLTQQKSNMHLRQECTLAPLIHTIANTHTSLLLQRNQQFQFELEEHARLTISHAELEIVLSNLITNASKYGDANSAIHIRLYYASEANEVLILSVSNTGEAIPSSKQRTIFEPFERLSSEPGSGLGLALVQQTMMALGGKIHLSSDSIKGTCFSLHLPLSASLTADNNWLEVDDANEQTPSVAVKSMMATPPVDVQNQANLLIVEDNQELADYLQQVLSPHFNCQISPSAEEALLLADSWVPDLILTDLNLPGKSGIELCAQLRAQPMSCHIPIMMLTASQSSFSRQQAFKYAINDFMLKPFDPTELVTRLTTLWQFVQTLTQTRATTALPDISAQNEVLVDQDQKMLTAINQYLADNYTSPDINAESIAEHLHLSLRQLQRKLKAVAGRTPIELLREYRLEQSRPMLAKGLSVKEVAFSVGFNSQNYFSTCYKAHFGISPNEEQNS